MKYFVTFEGIDGSGKSTVSKGVYDWLKKEGLDVVLTFEPTSGFIGETVKRCVEENCSPVTTALLFIADRVEHCKKIRGWLSDGKIVLCDRYADSTYAYQGAQLEGTVDKPMEWLQDVSKNFIVTPEKTFLF
ncbi:MAG TPA: dTMP kinase, partial [Thermoplasmatales archaeon]|nr:dTMP kinase [Thermoplasmatales archaeon]